MLNARRGRESRCHSSRYSSVCPHGNHILSLSLTFLSPPFSFSLFRRALCLQRRRHHWFAPWWHRLGLRSRVLRPAKYSRHVQIIATFLAPFFPPRRECIRHQALKIGSNVLDEAFSVRAIPPLLLSGAALSLSLSFSFSGPAVQGWTAAFQMHLCEHAPHAQAWIVISDQLQCTPFENTHRDSFDACTPPYSTCSSVASIISRKGNDNGRGTMTKNHGCSNVRVSVCLSREISKLDRVRSRDI